MSDNYTQYEEPTAEEWINATDYPWPTGPYIPHEPTVTQDAFLWYQGPEALYGGAAGGGKSDALLMAALQYVDVPGYAALLLRKTYTELTLENALLDRSMKWLSHTDASWNGELRRWKFPSGATLTFGFLQQMKDRARYQSAEFQYIGFDELTAFGESDYRFMFSRLRRLGTLNVPIRMRGATNPGGPGHKWVNDRFIKPAQAVMRGERQPDPDRIFVPAKLSDNPHIDQASYRQALHQLEPELAEQLLEGNWDVREPGAWVFRDHRHIDACVELGRKLWHEHEQGINPLPLPRVEYRGKVEVGLANCIDWGEFTSGYILWYLPQGGVLVLPSEVVKVHRDPVETTKEMLEQSMKFDMPLRIALYDAAGVQSMRTYRGIIRRIPRFKWMWTRGIPFKEFKRETINYLRILARRTYQGETERVLAIHPYNEELIRQLKGWRWKDAELEKIEKTDDHGPDALTAGMAPIAREYRAFVERELIELKNDEKEAYELDVEEEGGVAYVRS